MLVKPRYEPTELKILRCLNDRMNLTSTEASYYLNLEKGYKGEKEYDIWMEDLPEDWLVINDLLFEINNTVFQIDSVLIHHQSFYLIEIKNYVGDFYIEDDKWYTISKKEIKNPLFQLQRSESLFRQLLQELRINASIESYVIFINPNFQLYHAPLNRSIIFPAQLHRFKNKLTTKSLSVKSSSFKSAKQLLSVHLNESPYKKLPSYEYDQLEKGIFCCKCHSLVDNIHEEIMICDKCGCCEDVNSAVLRNIDEFKILFPDKHLTTNTLFEWCKNIKSSRTIRRILLRNFKRVGNGKSSYYV